MKIRIRYRHNPDEVSAGAARAFRIGMTLLAMTAVALLSALITMRLAIHTGEVEIPNLSGITVESTPVNISPGDEIVSSITENCRPGTLSCATWNIFSLDTRTGKSTTLAKTPSDGQVFNWAFGGALEPYYVVNCEDYPRDGHEIYQVIVFDERFLPIDPKWSLSVGTTATPQCGYKIDAKPFDVTLDY